MKKFTLLSLFLLICGITSVKAQTPIEIGSLTEGWYRIQIGNGNTSSVVDQYLIVENPHSGYHFRASETNNAQGLFYISNIQAVANRTNEYSVNIKSINDIYFGNKGKGQTSAATIYLQGKTDDLTQIRIAQNSYTNSNIEFYAAAYTPSGFTGVLLGQYTRTSANGNYYYKISPATEDIYTVIISGGTGTCTLTYNNDDYPTYVKTVSNNGHIAVAAGTVLLGTNFTATDVDGYDYTITPNSDTKTITVIYTSNAVEQLSLLEAEVSNYISLADAANFYTVPTDKLNALKGLDWEVTPTMDIVNQYQATFNECKNATPENTDLNEQTLFIENQSYPTKYLYAEASETGGGIYAKTEKDLTCVWTFKSTGSDTYKLYNSMGLYAQALPGSNNTVIPLTNEENSACEYTVEYDRNTPGYFLLKNENSSEYDYIHLRNNNETCRWSGYDVAASHFKPIIANEESMIETLITNAEGALAKTGVGYPLSDAPLRTTLRGFIDSEDYPSVYSTLKDYQEITEVQMPEDGKTYVMTFQHANEKNWYINYTADGLTLVDRGSTTANELPISAKYTCHVTDDGYVFANNAGKYLVWRGSSSSYEGSSHGNSDAYSAGAEWYIQKLLKNGGDMASATADNLFGCLAMTALYSKTGTTYSNLIAKNNQSFDNNHYDNKDRSNLWYNATFSSAIRFEEVTNYPNNPKLNTATIDGEEMNIGTFSAPFPTVIPEDVKAFYVDGTDDTAVTLKRIEGAIPANTGVILTAATNKTNALMAPAANESVATITDNKLVASSEGISSFEGYSNAYVLGAKNGNIAFYKASASGTKLGKNKAYLQLSEGAAPALIMSFGNGEATGIEGVEAVPAAQEGAIFDLSGRRVLNPTKGLYIIGGKKVYIK